LLSDREREQLLDRQARVYEVLNVATKPAQWFLGGLKLFLFAIIIVIVLVATPFYLLFTHQTVTGGDLLAALNAVAALVLFILCPYYVVLGGPLYFVTTAWWLETYHEDWLASGWFTLSRWFFVWVAIGYGWFLLKRWFGRPQDSDYQLFPHPSTPAVEVSSPATHEVLTEDSPLPEHMQQRMQAVLRSIIAEGEAVLREQGDTNESLVPQVADIESMPLGEALRSTNAMLHAVSARMRELVASSALQGAHTDYREASSEVREVLGMQQAVEERLTSVINRLKCEDAPYPVIAMEHELNVLRMTGAQIRQVARSKGLP
jgi:hypothetical protein